MTLILEIGLWLFIIVILISIVFAILTSVGAIVEAHQEGETEELIFTVIGTLFVISILLIVVGVLAVTLF